MIRSCWKYDECKCHRTLSISFCLAKISATQVVIYTRSNRSQSFGINYHYTFKKNQNNPPVSGKYNKSKYNKCLFSSGSNFLRTFFIWYTDFNLFSMLKASVQWSDGNGIPQTICWDSNDPELWIIIIIDFPPQDIIIIGIKQRQFVR